MSATTIAEIAERLDAAAHTANATPQIDREMSVEDAYAIQAASMARRFGRGETLIGMKMGFTSRAKMAQMGVHDMICGRLTDAMMIEDGGVATRSRFVHPRVEPEIAFLLRRPLRGAVSSMEALDAVAATAPALELIDSRYENFRFSLTDVIADNSSSSAFVIGGWCRPDSDLDNLGMAMRFDGSLVAAGSSAGILGHPLRSLVAAARLAELWGIELAEGSIVLAGGATAAAALHPGLAVSLDVQGLGRTGFTVED